MNFDGAGFQQCLATTLGVETQTAVALRVGVSKHRWSQALNNGQTTLPTLIRYAQRAGADKLVERLRAVQADREETMRLLDAALEDEVNAAIAASIVVVAA